MNNENISAVLDGIKNGAEKARWDCEVDETIAVIHFERPMPSGDDFSFDIAYDPELPLEEMIDSIEEAVFDECEMVSDPDYMYEIMGEPDFLDNETDAYRYANSLVSKMNALSECIADEMENIFDEPEFNSLDDIIADADAIASNQVSVDSQTRDRDEVTL